MLVFSTAFIFTYTFTMSTGTVLVNAHVIKVAAVNWFEATKKGRRKKIIHKRNVWPPKLARSLV